MTKVELNQIIEKMASYHGIKVSDNESHIIVDKEGNKKDLLSSLDKYIDDLFPGNKIFNDAYVQISNCNKTLPIETKQVKMKKRRENHLSAQQQYKIKDVQTEGAA